MKKILFTISALILGLAVWSFATTQHSKANTIMNEEWFIYVGGPMNQPGSYELITGSPDCPGSGTLCAIRAPKDEFDLPTQDGLTYLASISNNFTSEVSGQVEHKTP